MHWSFLLGVDLLFIATRSSQKLASCLHVSGVSPLTFGLHVHRDTACAELMELGFVELLILWFVARTWFFPQLIAVITYNWCQQWSCPETSPYDHFIAAITGRLRLVSAVHIVRPSSVTSPCDHFVVAIAGNLQLISAIHIVRPSSEISPFDHFIVAITGNLQLISAMHIIRSCFQTSSLWHASYKDGLVAFRSLPEVLMSVGDPTPSTSAEWRTFRRERRTCTVRSADMLGTNCLNCLANISSPEMSFFTRSLENLIFVKIDSVAVILDVRAWMSFVRTLCIFWPISVNFVQIPMLLTLSNFEFR